MLVLGGWVEGGGFGGVTAVAKHTLLGWQLWWRYVVLVMASSVGDDRGGDVGGESGVDCGRRPRWWCGGAAVTTVGGGGAVALVGCGGSGVAVAVDGGRRGGAGVDQVYKKMK
ncbi:hypothetical protein Tco_1236729 [Tanacetum coccineum]